MKILVFTFLTYYTVCFIPRDGDAVSSNKGCTSMPGDDDDCETDTNKWFYNIEAGACENYKYGDCPRSDNIFDNQTVCTETCKDVGKRSPKTKGGSFSAPGSSRHKRPSKKGGSEEGETGIGSKPVNKPKGGGFTKGGPKTRPMRPPRARPALPPPAKAPSGPGHCGARPKRGDCDDNSDKWYLNAAFYTCSRVPKGKCPTIQSFFDNCDDCFKKCRGQYKHRLSLFESAEN
ncbi:actinia tenebrosa protease inhibitors-like [Dermacentor silvarum]|uniref:actinia tenebrosa protease inhibitors-like n=1 Tax=Dermacentor silvarum TaxID=543639 RepID=UPI00210118D1|nr:actinia tenebrosa protease inhibitors-like [Dermacentor silvarum]